MISFDSGRMRPGALKTIKVQGVNWPDLAPEGSRCQIMVVNPNQLAAGDIVATSDGKFWRFWSKTGTTLWLTDRSGLRHETIDVKDGMVQKVILSPGLVKNTLWLMGALVGRLRRR